jgi:hypothetical protein
MGGAAGEQILGCFAFVIDGGGLLGERSPVLMTARVPAAVSPTAPIYTPQRRQIRNSAVPEPKR